jgi:hypothetical protein
MCRRRGDSRQGGLRPLGGAGSLRGQRHGPPGTLSAGRPGAYGREGGRKPSRPSVNQAGQAMWPATSRSKPLGAPARRPAGGRRPGHVSPAPARTGRGPARRSASPPLPAPRAQHDARRRRRRRPLPSCPRGPLRASPQAQPAAVTAAAAPRGGLSGLWIGTRQHRLEEHPDGVGPECMPARLRRRGRAAERCDPAPAAACAPRRPAGRRRLSTAAVVGNQARPAAAGTT